MKKALVTGGAGFIGLNLARRLSEGDHTIHIVDNFSRGRNDAALAALCEKPSVRLIRLDLSVPNSTDALDSDYDVIFHCAALLGVRNVANRPYDTLTLNVALTTEALRLAQRQMKLSSFVFTSTSEVYAGSLCAGLLQFPTPEDSLFVLPPLTASRTAYMLSKLYGEALAHQSGVPVIIIRPHNIYGPRMGTDHVVPELIQRMSEAEPGSELVIYSPTHSRTFCYIDDAVELILRLASTPAAVGCAWNIGSEAPEYGIMNVAEIVREVVGADLKLTAGENTPGSPIRRCPAMTRTNTLTGYHQRMSFEKGVEETFQWYKNSGVPTAISAPVPPSAGYQSNKQAHTAR